MKKTNKKVNAAILIIGNEILSGRTQDLNVAFLGEIPLVQSIREAGDSGRPAALQEETPLARAFEKITKKVIEELNSRNEILPPTEVIQMTNSVGCSTSKN